MSICPMSIFRPTNLTAVAPQSGGGQGRWPDLFRRQSDGRRNRKRSRPGRRAKRRWCWPRARRAIPTSSSRRLRRPGLGDEDKAGETHRQQGRSHRRRSTAADRRPSGWRSPAPTLAKAREMSRQRDLFRSARRVGARADRGGAGGDEPRVLAVLSERRLRRRLSERPTAISPASSPSPATAFPTSSPNRMPGRAPSASPAT